MPDSYETPPIVSREQYLENLAREHVDMGMPPEVAERIAKAAVEIADAVNDHFNKTAEAVIEPFSEEFHDFVPFAVLRAAARLAAMRVSHTLKIAEQQMALSIEAHSRVEPETEH